MDVISIYEFEIKYFNLEIGIINKNSGIYFRPFCRVIGQLLDSSDIHLEVLSKILNCQCWESFCKSDDEDRNLEFADLEISEHFQKCFQS